MKIKHLIPVAALACVVAMSSFTRVVDGEIFRRTSTGWEATDQSFITEVCTNGTIVCAVKVVKGNVANAQAAAANVTSFPPGGGPATITGFDSTISDESALVYPRTTAP